MGTVYGFLSKEMIAFGCTNIKMYMVMNERMLSEIINMTIWRNGIKITAVLILTAEVIDLAHLLTYYLCFQTWLRATSIKAL